MLVFFCIFQQFQFFNVFPGTVECLRPLGEESVVCVTQGGAAETRLFMYNTMTEELTKPLAFSQVLVNHVVIL